MTTFSFESNRRTFIGGAIGLACAATWRLPHAFGQARNSPNRICAFIKFIQSLSYDDLADTIAELGFDGIEATVRNNGYVLPERVEEELPKLVEALNQRKLEITVMTTNVNRVDQPLTQRVLGTAAGLGIKRYRMENYRYDHRRPVLDQLAEIRPALKDLVELSRELGISPVYQNHSGARYVGAVLWDLHRLIEEYAAEEMGVAFDIRHATVEGGLSWPTHFQLMRPHFAAVYVKDFLWQGRKPQNVPLGQGQVDPQFFKLLKQSDYHGPISLHVEYLPQAGTEKNIAALRADLKTLREFLAA